MFTRLGILCLASLATGCTRDEVSRPPVELDEMAFVAELNARYDELAAVQDKADKLRAGSLGAPAQESRVPPELKKTVSEWWQDDGLGVEFAKRNGLTAIVVATNSDERFAELESLPEKLKGDFVFIRADPVQWSCEDPTIGVLTGDKLDAFKPAATTKEVLSQIQKRLPK